MRKSIAALCLGISVSFAALADIRETYRVPEGEIMGGYVIRKIWLDAYRMPELVVPAGLTYTPVAALPRNVQPAAAEQLTVRLGMERKRPFALVQIPAYTMEHGQVQRLTGFTLVLTGVNAEGERTAAAPPVLAKAAATASVLATGTWHKIAIDRRGVYKIDYEFLRKNTGIGATIPSSGIRLFGNGGTMLPENNALPRYSDPRENALFVADGGDGVFGPGDYVLFYANGPMAWQKDSVNRRFLHEKNLYEDKSYYFLNLDGGSGLRMGQQSGSPAANVTVTAFDDYQVHEEDLVSIGKIGKDWVGETFSTQPGQTTAQTFTFSTGTVSGQIGLRLAVASNSPASGNLFSVAVNGQTLDNYMLNASSDARLATAVQAEYQVNPAGSSLNVRLSYQPASSEGKGYLDYIALNMRRPLSFAGGQLSFRDWQAVGSGRVARYELQNGGGGIRVWDVTDPLRPVVMSGALSGSTYAFAQDAEALHEFIAYDGSKFFSPQYVGKVENQNLHGIGQVDYIIVTSPAFVDAANRLADFHRQHSGLRTVVTLTQQVYNEFSSGSQDISAIRDFVKMCYDRAGSDTAQMPKYLLLFGDASYDYRNRVANNTNYVPSFESKASYYLDSASCNDDFFALLDDNEYIEDYSIPNTLDIGVGRLPVKTAEEANSVVNKILHYKSSATLGPWRLSNTYIGDNEDGAGNHLMDAEVMAGVVDELEPIYNDTKIYLDNMQFVSTPGGARCPEANKAINDKVFKGTFMINYSGHGNTQTLAHERILTADDFNTWKNLDKLPFMVTATCDFSQFDNPEVVSAGEKLVLKRDGGAIAMLTTTQAVYAGPNREINRQFLETQFIQNASGQWHTFGDAFRMGKNATYITIPNWWIVSNFRKFILLGDPALAPNFPKYFVRTESIKNMSTGQTTDSVNALGGYIISGAVTDVNGATLGDFNGNVYITFYDKPRTESVITKVYGQQRDFTVQNNIIYKGKASVTGGKFRFSFVAPKDINYDFGTGKISYYADNGVEDAGGLDSSVVIGGLSDHPYTENDPPVVRPYMEDTLFRDGGVTGSNTLLYVSLYDETGINVSGNSVGHDLIAVLDEAIDKPYILNDYYETATDDYRNGYVYFPVAGLSDGLHTFRVKAWDVNNNSGEGIVHFIVYNGSVMKVERLMNYPNPFSDQTRFVFEHNHPDEALQAQIRIYNTAGTLVRTLDQAFTPTGSRTNELMWDGTAGNGARVPSGVYVYRLRIATAQGIQATAYQKLVLIR